MTSELNELRLGVDADPVRIDSVDQLRTATYAMASQARRTIDILSRDLEPALYDAEPFLEAVQALVLANRRARVRILLRDNSRIVKGGHRLLELSRRLSSFISIRMLSKEYQDENRAMLLVDGYGRLQRPYSDRWEGIVSFHDPLGNREQMQFFNEAWEMGQLDPNLRRLHI